MIDLTGKKFGRLIVLAFTSMNKHRQALWSCKCVCGAISEVRGYMLKQGRVRSCGCLRRETQQRNALTHGEQLGGKKSPEYKAYHAAKGRCQNPNDQSYAKYGGRGIEFNFISFDEFLAEVGRRPSAEYSIDRIDNNGHYQPGNVRWATWSQQNRNQRQRRSRDLAAA